MSTAASLSGWVVAGIAAALLLAARRSLDARWAAVARACHELRGPLTAVRLGLSFGSRAGDLSPRRLRAIDAELGRAALALDDLARVPDRWAGRSPGLGTVDRVSLAEVVGDSVEAWRAVAEARGVTLRWGGGGVPRGAGGDDVPPGTVWGDRARLAQAIGNLLANAIEHGRGEVTVAVAVTGDSARVEVADDGPGLPAPVSELARRGRRARGAHGHGLAIAVAVAEAHAGRLSAAPAAAGARLVLELPAVGG